jgi:hypothetical protein
VLSHEVVHSASFRKTDVCANKSFKERTEFPPGLQPGLQEREAGVRHGLPEGGGRLVQTPWHQDLARDDRQWIVLSLQSLQ